MANLFMLSFFCVLALVMFNTETSPVAGLICLLIATQYKEK